MSSAPPSADNGYTIPLDADMTLALFQGVFTSVDARLGDLEAKGVDWDTALATQSTELAEAMFLNSVEPHVTQLQDEITVLRASIQDAEDQLTALLQGGIQADSVTIQPITDLDATNAQAAFAEIVSVTTALSQSVTSLGQDKLDASLVGQPDGVAGLDSEGGISYPVGTTIQTYSDPGDLYLPCKGEVFAQADYPDLAPLIGTPGNLWPDGWEHFEPSNHISWHENNVFVYRNAAGYWTIIWIADTSTTGKAAWATELDGVWTEFFGLGGDYWSTLVVDNGIAFLGIRGSSSVNYNDYIGAIDLEASPPVAAFPGSYSGFRDVPNKIDSLVYMGNGVVLALHVYNDIEYLARSTDKGQTWSEIYSTPRTTIPTPANSVAGSGFLHRIGATAYYFSYNGFIAQSTDDGQTWTVIRAGASSGGEEYGRPAPIKHLEFKGVRYFIRTDGTMLVTDDGGVTWEHRTVPEGISTGLVTDGEFVFQAGTTGKYWVSRDMVRSEERLSGDEAQTFSGRMHATGDGWLYRPSGTGVDRTRFNGRNYDPSIEFPMPEIKVGIFDPLFYVRAKP